MVKQDEVLHRAMISLYFPLGHGVIDLGPDVPDILLFQVVQFLGCSSQGPFDQL